MNLDLGTYSASAEITFVDSCYLDTTTATMSFSLVPQAGQCSAPSYEINESFSSGIPFTSKSSTGYEIGSIETDPNTATTSDSDEGCQACQDPRNKADPVHLPTGRFFLKGLDLMQRRLGCVSEFRRHYISQTNEGGVFGAGWRHSLERTIRVIPGFGAVETDERGFRTVFREDGTGGFLPASPRLTIQVLTDDSAHVSYPSGQVYRYRSDGKLDSFTDPDGNLTQLIYDGSDRLVRVDDVAGTCLEFDYDNDQVRSVRNAGGAVVQYAYTPDGQLAVVVNTRGETQSFGYNAESLLSQITYPDNSTTAVSYDEGRVVRVDQVDTSGRTSNYQFEYPSPTTRRIIDGNGAVSTYELNEFGDPLEWTPPDGRTYRYTYDTAGRLLNTLLPDGTTKSWSYTPEGRLLSYTTPKNETFLVDRDPVTQDPIRLIRPDGSTIQREFDAAGRVTKRIDPMGRTTSYTYDSRGLLTSMTDPGGATTTHTYDANGLLASTENALGERTTFIRDALGRVTETISPAGRSSKTEYEGKTLVSATIDALGNRTEFIRDSLGRLIATVLPNGARTEQTWVRINGEDRVTHRVDPLGAVSMTTYDTHGRAIAQTDAIGRTTQFILDATGRVSETIRPDGTTTQTVYDSKGRVASTIDPLGRETRFVYDQNDRVIQTIRPDGSSTHTVYDALGRTEQTVSPDAAVTSFEYNLSGQTVQTTDALGNSFQNVYDPEGLLTATSDPLGRSSSFEYDVLDRLTKSITALGFESTQTYDNDGNVVLRVNARGAGIQIILDPLNRPVQVINPLGNSVKTAYDSVGNITRIEDENGHAWTFDYDLAGRKIQETDPDGRSVSYTYDPAGQLLTKTLQDGASVEFTYDIMGRMTSRTFKDAAGVTDSVDTFTYDLVGNRIAAENENIRVTSAHDIMDREVSRTVLFKTTGIQRSLSFGYDVVGRRTSMEDDTGREVLYTYDLNSRLTRLEVRELVQEICDGSGSSGSPGDDEDDDEDDDSYGHGHGHGSTGDSDTDYDGGHGSNVDSDEGHGSGGNKKSRGRKSLRFSKTSKKKPKDKKGKKGKKAKITICHIPPGNPANRRTIRVSQSALQAHLAHGDTIGECGGTQPCPDPVQVSRVYEFAYDAVGNLIEARYPNGLRTRRSYDDDNRLTQIVHERLNDTGAVESVIESYTYERDPVGNILTIVNQDGEVHEYEYDLSDQLVRAALPSALVNRALSPERDDDPQPAQILEYIYDPAGNRIEERRDGVSTYSTYSDSNEILTSGPTTYTHDLRGNLVQAAFSTGSSHTYRYNTANRMVGFTSDVGSYTYGYSPDGQRVAATSPAGATTQFHWDGGRAIEEFGRSSGSTTNLEGKKYVWGLGQMLEQEAFLLQNVSAGQVQADHLQSREVLGALADHIGSVRVLTDEIGGVTERTTWGPWGARLEGGELSRVGYTGHSLDRESGLHYSVHRYLDPRNGRWTQRDPLGDIDGANLYRYVRNRPLVAFDPMGTTLKIKNVSGKTQLVEDAMKLIEKSKLGALVLDRVRKCDIDVDLVFSNTSLLTNLEDTSSFTGYSLQETLAEIRKVGAVNIIYGKTTPSPLPPQRTRESISTIFLLSDDVLLNLGPSSTYDITGYTRGLLEREVATTRYFYLQNNARAAAVASTVVHELTHVLQHNGFTPVGDSNSPHAFGEPQPLYWQLLFMMGH